MPGRRMVASEFPRRVSGKLLRDREYYVREHDIRAMPELWESTYCLRSHMQVSDRSKEPQRCEMKQKQVILDTTLHGMQTVRPHGLTYELHK